MNIVTGRSNVISKSSSRSAGNRANGKASRSTSSGFSQTFFRNGGGGTQAWLRLQLIKGRRAKFVFEAAASRAVGRNKGPVR